MSGATLDSRGLPPQYPLREDWEVTPRQLKAMLDAGRDVQLVDCRTPAEAQVVQIAGSLFCPVQDLPQRLAEFERRRHGPIVVYCHHGIRSLHFAAALRREGLADVKSLAGGIDLWARDIDASMPRY